MTIDEVIDQNFTVACKNKEEFLKVEKELEKRGRKWTSGVNYGKNFRPDVLNTPNWDKRIFFLALSQDAYLFGETIPSQYEPVIYLENIDFCSFSSSDFPSVVNYFIRNETKN